MIAHTPTPWRALASKIVQNDEQRRTIGRAELREDAAFIVRAVNNHAALVAALAHVIEYAEAYARQNDEPEDGDCVRGCAEARAALTRAKGGA